MSLCILFVGQTHRGKTTLIKKLFFTPALAPNNFINDVRNEYGGKLYDLKEFVAACGKLQKKICIFEEATIYLNNRSYNKQVEALLVGKWHSKNIYIFVFHSLRKVPQYILDLTDVIYLFKTNDEAKFVERRYGGAFAREFLKVASNADSHHFEKIDIK